MWTVFCTGATGLEPAISGLTGQRDKPASLRPQCTYEHTEAEKICQVLYGNLLERELFLVIKDLSPDFLNGDPFYHEGNLVIKFP